MQQPDDAVDQDEMAEVIDAKRGLKTLDGCRLRPCHETGVGYDSVERLAGRQERLGAGANAGKRSEVKLDQFQACTGST